ncbi:ribbon-helix-helix domain-containing protein [Clostridium perfringens]|uniref:ribbon-helix-helix domain-containing protein n=1 Tax=Clostridium perfringens TaxID=1502 RepID=UPI00123FE2DF|nr:ribbon-helix-helix domain-containing protein [Clostridium perfringens]MDU7726611.1 ribbon-helix-helix domain-containing protein [Clostridium perfringens]HAT4120278.1 ribbon-helix-helix domain-containing protein [Clostridium perfringens]
MGNLVNRGRLATSIDKDLLRKLNLLKEQTRIDRSKLLDEAIELLLEKHNFKEN